MVVGVTGGAAAVKSPFVLRRLREAGFEVRAAATEDAFHFVTRVSLALASGGEVLDRQRWFEPDGRALHLEWAEWADLLLVAPATADSLASAAQGRAGDPVSALVLAGAVRVAWAPAMNGRMWSAPAVERNVERLRGDGHSVWGPAPGAMAAVGETGGAGRMLEPEQLVELVSETLGRPAGSPEAGQTTQPVDGPASQPAAGRDLTGRHLLVSAGPTREFLDPVRFLSNPSSGRMGYSVAQAARQRGARVTLVSGPVDLPVPETVQVKRVISAEEMLGEMQAAFAASDAVVMTAAVADWRAAQTARQKEPKSGDSRNLELVRTPDILERLAAERKAQIMVGFAMETEEGVARAAEKARRKGLDFICLNYPTREGSAFGGEENEVTIVTPDGAAELLPRMSKVAIAHLILDRIARLFETGRQPGV